MLLLKQENTTSLESLESTIRTDGQVCQWFAFLVAHPAVCAKMMRFKDCPLLYQDLKKIFFLKNLLTFFFLNSVFFGILLRQPILWLVSAVLTWPLWMLSIRNKENIVRISKRLLQQDFDQKTLGQVTLYQISEYYGQTYSIPSLVDVIGAFDRISKVIFFSALLMNYIYQTKITFFFCFLVYVYCIVFFVVRTGYFYKKLKDIF